LSPVDAEAASAEPGEGAIGVIDARPRTHE